MEGGEVRTIIGISLVRSGLYCGLGGASVLLFSLCAETTCGMQRDYCLERGGGETTRFLGGDLFVPMGCFKYSFKEEAEQVEASG